MAAHLIAEKRRAAAQKSHSAEASGERRKTTHANKEERAAALAVKLAAQKEDCEPVMLRVFWSERQTALGGLDPFSITIESLYTA